MKRVYKDLEEDYTMDSYTKEEFEQELKQDAYTEEREQSEHDNKLHDIDYFTEHFDKKFKTVAELIKELAELHKKYEHSFQCEDLW